MTDGDSASIRRLEQLIEERHRLYEEQMKAMRDAVTAALAAADKAMSKAETEAERRFESLNELRGMLQDTMSTYARADMVDTNFKALDSRLNALGESVTSFHAAYGGRNKGLSDVWGWIIAAVTAAGAYIQWALGGK